MVLSDDSSSFNYKKFKTLSFLNENLKDKYDFISSIPISLPDILRFLEGIVKIQSNLHNELQHSASFYYFTSYFSSVNFSICMAALIPFLLPFIFQVIIFLKNRDNILIIGAAIATFFYSVIFITYYLLDKYFLNKIQYFRIECNDEQELDIYIQKPLIIFLIISSTTIFIIWILKTISNYLNQTSIYKNVIYSAGIFNKIFVLTFSIIISIKNFSLAIFIVPTLIFLIEISFKSSKSRNLTFLIISTFISLNIIFDVYFKQEKCLFFVFFFRNLHRFLLQIIGTLNSKQLVGFGMDSFKAKNAGSAWRSVMGSEFRDISSSYTMNMYDELVDNFSNVENIYRKLKVFPILQWSTWINLRYSEQECKKKRNFLKNTNILSEILYRLARDARCLKSTMFNHLLFGMLPPIILAMTLTFL